MYVFACCVQYVFTRWNSKQTYYKHWHREQPEVHQLQVCIKATGTNIKISCRKPSSSVDGDLSMQQNGFVHRWWPWKQWFKQTPTYKLCFDPLWNKRSKRNIIFRFNHILKRTCYMFHKKGLFHPHYFHPHYMFLASKQYGLTRRWSTPEKRLCLTYKSPSGWCRNVLPSRWMCLPNMKTFPKKLQTLRNKNTTLTFMDSLVVFVANGIWRCFTASPEGTWHLGRSSTNVQTDMTLVKKLFLTQLFGGFMLWSRWVQNEPQREQFPRDPLPSIGLVFNSCICTRKQWHTLLRVASCVKPCLVTS